tara:strand:+ start:8048 stop:8623 length:576 start_codon:yes stop_codon:yes gene_type:complete
MNFLIFIITGFILAGSITADSCTEPNGFIKDIVNDVVSSTDSIKEKDRLVKSVSTKLRAVSDSDYVMGKILGAKYRVISGEKKKQLEQKISNFIIKGFVGALTQVESSNAMSVYPFRGKVTKYSNVRARYTSRSGEKVKLTFALSCKSGNQWKLQDVVVDGVSLVDGFVAQLRPVVEKDGVDGLLAFLSKK